MEARYVNNVLDSLSGDSSDDSSEGDDDSDISDVRIIENLVENREVSEVDESSSSATVSSSSAHSGTVVSHARSLLECLKTPKRSELSRKRRIHCNPPVGKRKCKGAKTSSKGAVSVSPQQRIKEFSEENLTVSNGKLFCLCCREELNVKKSSVKNHIKSSKHQHGKVRLQKKEKREKEIGEALKRYNNECHLVGETLPLEQQTYRVKVIETFLRAAVPLRKLEYFRDILEQNAYRLSDRRHMSDLIPFVLKQEQEMIKKEITGKHVSVAFDGTTRLGEAFAVVIRYVSEQWNLEQRLIRMQLLAKSLKGQEIARELIHILSTDYNIGSHFLLAAMRDRASTNDVAMRTVAVVYPELLDVGCFSHTIDLVGEHFHTTTLTEFGMLWVSLFAHSPKVKMLWREQTGMSMPSYSPTRWWSRWEVYKQLMVQFGDLEPFIRRNDDVSPTTRSKILTFFSDSTKKTNLQIELAAIIDYGEPFVKATYTLEGDGPLALQCFEVVEGISNSIRLGYAPNVEAVAKSISKGSLTAKQKLIDHAKKCVEPGHSYFNRQLTSSLKIPLQAFKSARLFLPSIIYSIKPDVGSVDSLAAFPFLRNSIDDLKKELHLYIAKVQDVDITAHTEILKWWKQQSSALPNWSSAAKKVLLVQPSSASSERAFSLLNASFRDQQESALQDYIETSLMLQYNRKKDDDS